MSLEERVTEFIQDATPEEADDLVQQLVELTELAWELAITTKPSQSTYEARHALLASTHTLGPPNE